MKRIFPILLLLTFACRYYVGDDWAVHDREREAREQRRLDVLSVLLYAAAQPGIVWHDCRLITGSRNSLYPLYWGGFVRDNIGRPAPLVTVRGDSTQDFANGIPGHFAAYTSNRAVAGNTACDMIEQLPAIPQRGQAAVYISTYGGNDLLRGLTASEAAANVTALFDQTRATWPNARIVGVGIHPTRIASAAALACQVNTVVRAHLATMANVCDVDPYPIFGKACGELADASQMLPGDDIHYSEVLAAKLKTAVYSQCGLAL